MRVDAALVTLVDEIHAAGLSIEGLTVIEGRGSRKGLLLGLGTAEESSTRVLGRGKVEHKDVLVGRDKIVVFREGLDRCERFDADDTRRSVWIVWWDREVLEILGRKELTLLDAVMDALSKRDPLSILIVVPALREDLDRVLGRGDPFALGERSRFWASFPLWFRTSISAFVPSLSPL